jgi:serine/threonine protein kinase
MFGLDLKDLVCVRRLNEAANSDEVYLALRIPQAVEAAVHIYAQPLESERDRERFAKEVATLQTLNGSPYVLTIQDSGVTGGGRPYVVMDFCPAGSLSDHLVAVGRLTPAEVRAIGSKLAEALAEAHKRDIYHRNLKPANILLDRYGEPALADFRLLTLATSNGEFGPTMPDGPRPYMAPEAFLPELMTGAADIYALGATLYSLLSGSEPRAVDPMAVAIDGDTLADLPRVPWALMSVLRQAMSIDPRDRFANAEQMRDALSSAP